MARAADLAALGAGVVVLAVSSADAVITWRSDSIWIPPNALAETMVPTVCVAFVWLFIRMWLLGAALRSSPVRLLGAIRIVGLAVVAACCVVVVAGSVLHGATKGSLRVQPNGQHQVSVDELNQARWTTVTVEDYRIWEARFIRGDTFFTFPGFIAVAAGVAVTSATRKPRQ